MRIVFNTLLFILLFCVSTGISAERSASVDSFFKTREVIGFVEFANSSHKLSNSSKKYLDNLAPLIKNAQVNNKIIRFEGNVRSSLDNNKDVNLAMYRAKSVQDYLRKSHFIGNPVFLNGSIQKVNVSTSERVEIAIYTGSFEIENAPIHELITSKFSNGME